MASADLQRAAWFADAAFAVGELHDISGSAASAVVFPGPALALPPSTMRNLRSIAVLRLRGGPLWVLGVVGHRWTPDRLAFVADMLEAHGEEGLGAVLTDRLSDELGLPNIRIELPTKADLEGSSWSVRSLALALGLAHVFAGGAAARGPITSSDIDELVTELGSRLSDALMRFRSSLDRDALARCGDYGDSALRVYNYLAADEHRRNRMQFGGVLPVFLQAVATAPDKSPYRVMRQAIDAGQPLAPLVCQAIGVGPSVFRSLVGVPVAMCGARWLESPVALMRLISAIRPDRRPGLDPGAWATLNRLVEHAESVIGRRVETSLVGQMSVRDAVHARPGLHAQGSVSEFDIRAMAMVEDFREEICAAVGASQLVRAKVARATAHDGLRQVIDRWLLQRTRKQLATLAVRWQDAYAAEKAGDASLIACLTGERFWALLPSPFTSADGRRRVVPLVTRQLLVDFGTAMANCLEASHLQAFDTACRSGGTFVVGLVDSESGAPRSTAEFKVGRVQVGARMTVEVVQHTARRNAAPSQSCVSAMRELLRHVEGDAVQRHLRIGVTAVRSVRGQGASAISAAQRETRLRALRLVLGDQPFEDLWQCCEQARRKPGELL